MEHEKLNIAFLAFLHLVGITYFKKYASGFSTPNPVTHFNTFDDQGVSTLEHHYRWLHHLRQNLWDGVQFENEIIPSNVALARHWKRTCWVIDMWHQADKNQVILQPIIQYGWQVNDDFFTFDWDSDENMKAITQHVEALLKGCRYKTGCRTQRCGCKAKGNECSEGCECTNYSNIHITPEHTQHNTDTLMEVTIE